MSNSIQSLYNWYRNTLRNPKYRWWIILGTLAYLFSPFDIAPDFLPVVGQIDDLAVLTLMIAEVSQMLVEYYKSRNSESVTAANPLENNTAANTSSTVDVEASTVQ